MDKETDAFRTISEVAEELDVPKHVLRFWEAKFPQIRPMKRGGGRRYYRPEDLDLLRGIRHLLHAEGYMIKGVQKILREQGVDFVKRSWRERGASARRRGGADAPSSAPPPPSRRPRRHEGPPPPPLTGVQRERVQQILAELEALRGLLAPPSGAAAAARGRRAPADG